MPPPRNFLWRALATARALTHSLLLRPRPNHENNPRLRPICFALAVLLPNLPAQATETDIIPVAVLDLEASDPRLKERGAQLATLISTNLSTRDGVATVERPGSDQAAR